MQKTILFRGSIALALLSFTVSGYAQQKPARRQAAVHSTTREWSANHQYMSIDEDSSVTPPQTIITYKSDSLYNIVLSGGKLTSLYVNGRQVPADSFYVYDDVIKRVKAQMERDKAQAIRDKAQAVRDKAQAVRDKAQAEKDVLQAGRDAEQAMRDKRQAERDAEQAVRDSEGAKQDRAQAMRDKQQAERDTEQAGRDAAQAGRDKQQAEHDGQQVGRDKDQAGRDKEQAIRDKEQAGRDREQAGRDKEQAIRDKEQARLDKIQAEEDKAMVKALMADVVKEGLAPDAQSVTSLILDESVFYVNGKKQSDELQQKFKVKFLKKEGYSIHFHNGSMSVGRMYE
jgi:hypothetical protein